MQNATNMMFWSRMHLSHYLDICGPTSLLHVVWHLFDLPVCFSVLLATSGKACNHNSAKGTWPHCLLTLRIVISLLGPCCSLPCWEEQLLCSLHCATATDIERLHRWIHLGDLHKALHLTCCAGCIQKYTYVKHLFIYINVYCCIGITGSVCRDHKLSG